jgi:two-component system chemotaxis response regulator CheY
MAYDFDTLNILVADDSELICALMETILKNLGVGAVSTVTGGKDAIDLIKTQKFDLAFVDWKMEPVDGIAFTKSLRSSPIDQHKFMPIIMISGYTEENRIRQAMSAGVSEFLAKPLTAAAVYSRLAWVIEHPRDYIKSSAYFGPCRRRRAQEFSHPDRRRSLPVAAQAIGG